MPARIAAKAPPVKAAPAWQTAFLRSIKAPVTHANVAFLTSWWKQEGGDLTNNARFNWLNTTHGEQFPTINSVGVRSYPNMATGLAQLRQVFSYYPALTKSLQTGAVNLRDPGVQADLNKWLSGNAKPGMSQYISRIASGLGGPQPVQDAQNPAPAPVGAENGLQAPSRPYQAPNLTVPGFSGVHAPLESMPGMPAIGQVRIVSGPGRDGTPLPSLRVVHDPGVKPSAQSSEVVDFARHYLGTKYVFGGTTPAGFDCSGFVQWVYGHMGVKLPRTTWEQAKVGTPVAVNQLKAGDIVFFHTENDPRGAATHEGMMIDATHFIQAPHTGSVVMISKLEGYYRRTFVAARRVT